MYYPKVSTSMQCLLNEGSSKTKSFNKSPNFDHVCKIPGEYNASLYADLKDSLANCSRNMGGGGRGSSSSTWVVLHAAFMLAGWGILIPYGVSMAMRRQTAGASWFSVHRFCNGVGLIAACAGIIIALANHSAPASTSHGRPGIAVMLLGLLQPLNAFFRPHKDADAKAQSSSRKTWEFWHKNAGRLTLFLAFVQMIYGGTIAHDLYSATQPHLQTGAFVVVGMACAGILYSVYSAKDRLLGNGTSEKLPDAEAEMQEIGTAHKVGTAPKM